MKFSFENIKIIPLFYIAFVLCTTGLPLYLSGYSFFMKEIYLTRGKTTMVDDEDYDMLMKFKWIANVAKGVSENGGKNFRVMKNKTEASPFGYMHRLIMNVTDPNIWVDHVDRNPLNNQRSNLRLCNQQQSACNVVRISLNKPSKFRGVYICNRDKKWRVFIHYEGKCVFLGRFKDELEAARVYNEAAKKYQGEFAVLNKI